MRFVIPTNSQSHSGSIDSIERLEAHLLQRLMKYLLLGRHSSRKCAPAQAKILVIGDGATTDLDLYLASVNKLRSCILLDPIAIFMSTVMAGSHTFRW